MFLFSFFILNKESYGGLKRVNPILLLHLSVSLMMNKTTKEEEIQQQQNTNVRVKTSFYCFLGIQKLK